MNAGQSNHSDLELLGFLPKRLFHAYCLVGRDQDWSKAIHSVAEALTIHEMDQYIMIGRQEPVGIGQVRELESFMKLQPVGTLKLVALNAVNLSNEASHALLKSVEEPLGQTIIILCVESLDLLLPTLRSRCQVIRINRKQLSRVGNIVQSQNIPSLSICRTWSLTERFRFVEEVVKKGGQIIEMLDFWLENLYGTKGLDKQSAAIMRCLLESRKQLLGNVQPRPVLEYIMLILPHQ